MNAVDLYRKALSRLAKKEGFAVPYQVEGDTLRIQGIPFQVIQVSNIFQSEISGQGVLVPKLSKKEKDFCRQQQISYLTTEGSLYLEGKHSTLLIEPKDPTRRLKKRDLRPAWLKDSGLPRAPHTPTQLISPNAFAILDVLFRLPTAQIESFTSGLQFAKAYSLYQPKLSTLMSTMRVRSLLELRTNVGALSVDWWMSALRYPATRRAFTPFFEHAKPYHSLDPDSTPDAYRKFEDLVQVLGPRQLAPGPTALAKGRGLLRDEDTTAWATPSAIQELKKKLRLVPGSSREKPTWLLATPLHGMEREAILSHSIEEHLLPIDEISHDWLNVFRAIWDLSYGDARLEETQAELLKRILK